MENTTRNNMITVENTRIFGRNFSGEEKRFNPAGKRTFCLALPFTLGQEMEQTGWNVKFSQPLDPTDEPGAYVPVEVSFNGRPPKIFIIDSTGKHQINEETVNTLDWLDIRSVDATINGFTWDDHGTARIKAYLRELYIIPDESPLDRKYNQM